MEQETGIAALYAESFRGYGAVCGPFSPGFPSNGAYKRNSATSYPGCTDLGHCPADRLNNLLPQSRSLMMDLGGLLNHRRGGGKDLPAIARQRRIDSMAVDHLLGLLGRLARCGNMPVPSLGVEGPPRSQ